MGVGQQPRISVQHHLDMSRPKDFEGSDRADHQDHAQPEPRSSPSMLPVPDRVHFKRHHSNPFLRAHQPAMINVPSWSFS